MEKTYVTFGQTHAHRHNGHTLDKDSVAVIKCNNAAEGRDLAFEWFGDKFFTTYHEGQWNEKNIEWFPRGYINAN